MPASISKCSDCMMTRADDRKRITVATRHRSRWRRSPRRSQSSTAAPQRRRLPSPLHRLLKRRRAASRRRLRPGRGEVAEEREPARTVLAAGDLRTEDLPGIFWPSPWSPAAPGTLTVRALHPLAHLQHQRASREERVGAGIERGVRNACTGSSSSLSITLTCDSDGQVIRRVSAGVPIGRVLTRAGSRSPRR